MKYFIILSLLIAVLAGAITLFPRGPREPLATPPPVIPDPCRPASATQPDQHIEWELLTSKGAGMPQIDLGNSVIAGFREEVTGKTPNNGKRIAYIKSVDGGISWREIATIVQTTDPNADMGDGSLVVHNGELLYAYRFNTYNGPYSARKYYSIRVRASGDGGLTWHDHSTVQENSAGEQKVGLWTPQLFVTAGGQLQIYYDDGNAPSAFYKEPRVGQWAVLRTWDNAARVWTRYTVVSRPPTHLTGKSAITSDGARTPIELSPGHIWVPVESNILNENGIGRSLILKFAESTDNGKTWSWEHGTWPVLYRLPPSLGGTYYDWSWPLAARTKDGVTAVVFRSNELSPAPTQGTSYQTDKYLFYLLSIDGNKTWSKGQVSSKPIFNQRIISLSDGTFLLGYRLSSDPRNYCLLKGTVSAH